MNVEREACLQCGEPVSLDARICPSCRASALVDVALGAPVSDGRSRFKIAKALVGLGPPVAPLVEVQGALQAARSVVVRGATRSFGYRVLEVLESNGASGSFEVPKATSGSLSVRNALVAAGVLAALGLGWLGLRSVGTRPTAPARPVASSVASGGAPAAGSAAKAALSTEELARRCLPSAVSLRKDDRLGSGFFVSTDEILTNAHVAGGVGESVQIVLPDGRQLDGSVVRSDETLDLALVKASTPGGLALPLGDAGALAVGEKIVLIGNPLGLDFTVHEGSISSLSRSYLGVAYIQLDAKINPGNSGGPLLDSRGRVVGIVSLKLMNAEGIGLALPINYAYGAEAPFVPAPPGQGEASGFREMVAKAEADEGQAQRELSSLELLPGLAGASVDQYQRLVVRIIRPARSEPGFQEITIKVYQAGEVFCTLKGDVSAWQALPPRAHGVEPRVQAWLDRIGLSVAFYAGEAALRWDQCPREKMRAGIELQLEGADPSMSTIRLN